MPFANRVRLPFYLHQPQFPTESIRFRRADGTTKVLSSVIRKTYKLTTDWLAENAHQRLVIALNHKFVSMEGTRLISNVVLDSEYDISWQDFLDYPLGQATSSVQVSPFDVSNDNCITCAQASQLEAHDDNIGTINEGGEDEYVVIANDHICCSPVTFAIVWWDLTYIDLVTINEQTGNIFITMKAQTPDSGGPVKLVTYRVTCPDGSYDDADVYGTVTGTLVTCVKPTITDIEYFPNAENPNYVIIRWSPNLPAFDYTMAECSNPNNPFSFGSDVNADGQQFDVGPFIGQLHLGSCYIFCVRKDCGVDGESAWECLQFITPGGTQACSEFLVSADDGTTGNNWYNFSYRDCGGQIVTGSVQNLHSTPVCMIADAVSHEPAYFVGGPFIDFSFTNQNCTL